MKTILASVEATPSRVLRRPLNVTRLRPSYAAFTAERETQAVGLSPRATVPELTLGSVLSTDEGGVHILQQNEALLGSHAQQVVEPVVCQPSLAQVQHTYAVLQLSSQSCAESRRSDSVSAPVECSYYVLH